ncbi:hypothetical protein [Lysobacter gummosus]|uniref:hypothetical protein n=1 Tax=Lysobacter gummosus TaxID=262324 RepID=UPI00364452B0
MDRASQSWLRRSPSPRPSPAERERGSRRGNETPIAFRRHAAAASPPRLNRRSDLAASHRSAAARRMPIRTATGLASRAYLRLVAASRIVYNLWMPFGTDGRRPIANRAKPRT